MVLDDSGDATKILHHRHPDRLGVKLTPLSAAQANYLNLHRSDPFKPEHYRY
jgi:hypothetical protein